MTRKGESFGIRFVLICALAVFLLTACTSFDSVFGPSEPAVGTVNPTFAATMKDMDATSDALGSLRRVKLNGVTVNDGEASLLIFVNSQAQQADLSVEVPAINGKLVRLTDRTGATGENLPLFSGQQVVTATFPKPINFKDWSVLVQISNVNGKEGNFGWPLPIEPYYK